MDEQEIEKNVPKGEEEAADGAVVADGVVANETVAENSAVNEVVATDAAASEGVVADEEAATADEGAANEAAIAETRELLGLEEAANEDVADLGVGSYSDYIAEGFSVESNVKKFVKYAKIPEKVAHYLLAALYLVVGILCVAIPDKIEFALPYIVGGGMAAVALVTFIYAIISKEYKKTNTNKTAMSFIAMGLSVMIILEHEWAHTFIPIVWGVIGLFEAGHAFNHALSRISRGMRSSYYIIKGIIEVVVAFLLLYEPESYGEMHIIVFGVSLIIDGVTSAPIIKKVMARR